VERRLAAIVAVDVAGYSRLMGMDEEGTLAQLKGHRQALVDPAAPILFRHPLDSPLCLSELSCGAAVSGERTDIENGQQVQPVQLRRDVLPFLLRVRRSDAVAAENIPRHVQAGAVTRWALTGISLSG
jgi:hypothetical protein